MLLVHTSVRQSSIAGLGLFAEEAIPAGSMVSRFDARLAILFSREAVNALPKIAFDHLEKYGWILPNGLWCLSVDNGRFTNHQKSPNTKVVRGTGEVWFETYALREISVGEEITEDYGEFDPDFDPSSPPW